MLTPPPIAVANIGMADSFIIMVLALVVFGPRRLPQIGRQIGKLMYEFRKASNDFKFQMEEELRLSEEADRRKREEAERQQRLALAAQNTPAETPAAPAASTEPAAPAVEASYPRIQAPSTGEPVAASRPGSGTTESEAPAETTVVEPLSNEAAADENRAATEHVANNG
jgi:sec-independent protein translocase protein TatB